MFGKLKILFTIYLPSFLFCIHYLPWCQAKKTPISLSRCICNKEKEQYSSPTIPIFIGTKNWIASKCIQNKERVLGHDDI